MHCKVSFCSTRCLLLLLRKGHQLLGVSRDGLSMKNTGQRQPWGTLSLRKNRWAMRNRVVMKWFTHKTCQGSDVINNLIWWNIKLRLSFSCWGAISRFFKINSFWHSEVFLLKNHVVKSAYNLVNGQNCLKIFWFMFPFLISLWGRLLWGRRRLLYLSSRLWGMPTVCWC